MTQPTARKYVKYVDEQQACKNLPDAEKIVNLSAEVTTANVDNAGTDADVSLVVGGERFVLERANYNDFERGDTDTYYFRTSDLTLRQLRRSRIVLSHDGSGRKPGWKVANFVIQVQFAKTSRMALYKRWGDLDWLAKDEGPWYTTEVELQLGDEI